MAIDANILFQAGRPTVQLDDPMNKLAQLGQVQGLQNQNALAQLQLKQAQQQDQDRTAMANAYQGAVDPATGRVDYAKVTGNLAGAGAGAAIPGVQKSAAEAQKAQREADKATLEQAIQKQALISQYAGSATDQASWTAARNAVAQLGIDISQVPEQFDPATAKQLQLRALTGVQQLDQHWKQQGYDLDVRKQNEVERNNKAQNSVAQGQLGVSQGQLGVAQQRLAYDQSQPKGVYDKDNGIIVDPRTGKSIAVTDQNGQPIGASGGKPSGEYLKQATAYQNMDDALTGYKKVLSSFKTTDSLSPSKRAELNTAYQNALLQAKEIYNLGVLNGGDERILTAIINNPLDIHSALTPRTALLKQAEDLQGIVARANENSAKVNRQKPVPLNSSKVPSGNGAAPMVPPDIGDLLNKYGG